MSDELQDKLQALCYQLAKATSAAVRLYRQKECLYYYSVYHLHPDPVTLYLEMLLEEAHKAGVFVTPLGQSYGYLTLGDGWRLVIGPSRLESEDRRALEQQLFLLGVEPKEQKNYIHTMRCFPAINAERMGWTVSVLCSLVERKPFSMEELYVNIRPENADRPAHFGLVGQQEELPTSDTQELLDRAYQFERLILSYVEQGETEQVAELFSSRPSMSLGRMSADSLRQAKDAGICAAAVASRTAIRGGVDRATAFRLSDLYIQKIELLRDARAVEALWRDLFVDFADQVRQARYHTGGVCGTGEKDLFLACAEYVSQNIYAPIRADELAETLGYTRSYLCSCFKRQTGMTLTQYCLQEKVLEARRMLQFTGRSLSEIAALLAFSSQSHFQTVFKRLTGETPLAYRRRMG